MEASVTISLSDYEFLKTFEKAVKERKAVSLERGVFVKVYEKFFIVEPNEIIESQDAIIQEQNSLIEKLRNLKWWQRL